MPWLSPALKTPPTKQVPRSGKIKHWIELINIMRWLFVAALVALSAPAIYASETGNADTASLIDGAGLAPGVIVSAIPTPTPVTEVLQLEGPAAGLNAGKKLLREKKLPVPTMMLSRTERRQMQLLVVQPKIHGHQRLCYEHNDDGQTGLDELVLHRSYSRPKVADDLNDDNSDSPAITDHVRLRLLFARLKAVEAHVLNQVPEPDEPLPESVLLRLKEARLKAVQAHQNRFS